MVYTVTFNPAVDYVVHAEELKIGAVNRSLAEDFYFGGKGVNVSLVLKELGIKSRALGFVAGFTGEAIEKGLSQRGIETDFVRLDSGFSRINVKIKAGGETELNGRGPDIPRGAVEKLFSKLDGMSDGDFLVLAGSIPPSLPSDIYEKIMARLAAKKIKTAVDATNDLLTNVLKYRPFLIKPNDHELEEIFGRKLSTKEEIAECAMKLKEMGAENVLVSMAGDGAVLIDANGETHFCGVCHGTVKNSVGAGDSMVAGFLAGCKDGDYGRALMLGTAAGGATAFSEGLAKAEDICALLRQLEGGERHTSP